MIIDIKCACSGKMGDTEIYIDGKITYFARIGKKITLLDKNKSPVQRPIKPGAFGKTTLRDDDRKKTHLFFSAKDKNKKVYYGIRPIFEDRVFRVQTFENHSKKYLLFTQDKIILAAALRVFEQRTVYRLYIHQSNEDLSRLFIVFILHYMKKQKSLKTPN